MTGEVSTSNPSTWWSTSDQKQHKYQRRNEKHNKEGTVPNLVVFSLVIARCYTRYSGVRWSAAYLQSSTRSSDATSTSERSPWNCNTHVSKYHLIRCFTAACNSGSFDPTRFKVKVNYSNFAACDALHIGCSLLQVSLYLACLVFRQGFRAHASTALRCASASVSAQVLRITPGSPWSASSFRLCLTPRLHAVFIPSTPSSRMSSNADVEDELFGPHSF